MSAAQIPVIGIIGGIGSGKTAVAEALGNEMSVVVLDADRVGHDVLKDQTTKVLLSECFGQEIFDGSGEVERTELARMVFGKEQHHKLARQNLDRITHPRIRERLRDQLETINELQSCDVVVLDAALLLEAGWSEACDAIIFLQVPEQTRIQRVLERGWTEQQFKDREASQLSLEEKSTRADFTIQNDGKVETAAKALAQWIKSNLLDGIHAKSEHT